ncbi:plasmid stabilization system protein ParE [Methylopila capsulata]|uniref:Plasmid stabilization system protein ParE n=1 Tax=Methylopila capsulata TaxID=61654 RepID=A0ABS2T7H0_9HYPH|nr:plasmid stabilization system protein ParE [Methylopila capsulata]
MLSNVAERSPQGARAVRARIQTVVELLREHPHSGQLTSRPRLRRIVVVPYPYLVFYEVRGVEVIVVAVRHAARDPAGMPG